MKKILLLAPQPFYTERGTPIAILNLISALSKAGYQVDLLTFPQGQDLILENTRTIRVGAWLPLPKKMPVGFSFRKLLLDVIMISSAIKLCRKNEYVVLHGVEEASFIALVARVFVPKMKPRPKVVYDMDSSMSDQLVERWPRLSILHKIFDSFEAFIIRRVDHVLAVCQALKEKGEQHWGHAPITVIEDISDNRSPQRLNASPQAEEIAVDDLSLVLENCKHKMLYVGNLEHYQGVGLVLDAMAENDAPVDLGFIVIGGLAEDIAAYQNQARELNISERVAFLGPRPVQHLQQYLSQVDVLVSPRLKGVNTPMKIYTYLGAGKPIIATKIASHTQVLTEQNACLLAPEAKAVAAGMKTLFSDPQRAGLIAKRALKDAQEHYSYTRFSQRIDAFYQKVIDG